MTPIHYLKGTENEQLRVACENSRQRALLVVLLSTGMRAGEVVLVQRNDIDWEQNQMIIYGTKDREYRTVFLNAQAKYWLQQYLAERDDDCPALYKGPGPWPERGVHSGYCGKRRRAIRLKSPHIRPFDAEDVGKYPKTKRVQYRGYLGHTGAFKYRDYGRLLRGDG